MGNVAATYSLLGRHADAITMSEKALQLCRRVHPENHPDIGECDVRSDALLAAC